jgi:hypothetical protein
MADGCPAGRCLPPPCGTAAPACRSAPLALATAAAGDVAARVPCTISSSRVAGAALTKLCGMGDTAAIGEWARVGLGVVVGCLLQRGCFRGPAPPHDESSSLPPRPIAQSVSDLVGNTPMIRLGRLAPEHSLVGKCEFMSVYSLKDRPVRQIIAEAEAAGQLPAGGTLIETTSGNTGMAVASQAAAKGYRCILCMCEIQSEERRAILRALGADLRLSPRDQGTKGAKKMMMDILAEHPEYVYVGQHQNMANPRGHFLTTGPEIWRCVFNQWSRTSCVRRVVTVLTACAGAETPAARSTSSSPRWGRAERSVARDATSSGRSPRCSWWRWSLRRHPL